MKKIFRRAVVLSSLLLQAATVVFASGAEQPNIIILFADDLGYGELSCQGNLEIPTPHIDSIASNGVRFTDGYVAGPNCSPSRAGLLTGRIPTRSGYEFRQLDSHPRSVKCLCRKRWWRSRVTTSETHSSHPWSFAICSLQMTVPEVVTRPLRTA